MHQLLLQWKCSIISSVLVKWSSTANKILAGFTCVLYLATAILWGTLQLNPTLVSFLALVTLVDIAVFILVVISLRRYSKMKAQLLNLEYQKESKRVQLTLALSLLAIVISGSTFGTSALGFYEKDMVQDWILIIQIASSYYYFYNVALLLSGKRASTAASSGKHSPSNTKPTQETSITNSAVIQSQV